MKVKSDEVVKKKDPLPEIQIEDNSKKAIDIEKKDRREMHKTTSIFLRNLAPSITKAEVEAVSYKILLQLFFSTSRFPLVMSLEP